jgi:hypothetical protein
MPHDTNQLAAEMVKLATGQPEEPEPDPDEGTPAMNSAAVAHGRLGGLKGGIARKAVQARGKKARSNS